jgi:hypothetical protein
MRIIDKKAIAQWEIKCQEIATATDSLISNEAPKDREKRIAHLLKNYNDFVRYYFPNYAQSPCGYFHIAAAKHISQDDNAFAVLEWAREHAKSVHADVFIPLYLKAQGKLDGLILVGKNETDACRLLGDLQAQLLNNKRFQADYGEQFSYGSWELGDFTTQDRVRFTAIGRGQSPRGMRNEERRPNYCVIDDIDDDEMVRNPRRVSDCVDWILGALYGALAIKKARLVMVGNRIHKKSVLAMLVGGYDTDTPKRENVYHSRVNALDKNGNPTWIERYTLAELQLKFQRMGSRLAQREYFNNPITEGKVFKNEWMQHWLPMNKLLAKGQYERLIVYCDPSFKSTTKSDYKAIVLMGKIGKQLHIIKYFCRQCSVPIMVRWFYDLYEQLNPTDGKTLACEYYMEANFMQDLLLDEFMVEGELRGYQLPISGDHRQKPDKASRIESIAPLFERELVLWNKDEENSKDMQTAREQFFAFETGSTYNDDAPDAAEGAVYKHMIHARQLSTTRVLGKRHVIGY